VVRIAVVCLGNICRSPMADVVLEDRVASAGLADEVEVISAGTGDYHLGEPMDRRAAATLRASGYDPTRHRSKQFEPQWFDELDLVLAMDTSNYDDLARLAGDDPDRLTKLRMFRSFDPVGPGDVPDPYFGGDDGFITVLGMVERTADRIVAELDARLAG
jgi:protein-tyrosine phosphatase